MNIKKNTPINKFFLLFFSAILPLVFFSSSLNPWGQDNIPIKYFRSFLFSIQYSMEVAQNNIKENYNKYIFFVNTAEENKKLKRELSLLKVRNLSYQNQIKEFKRLKKIITFTDVFNEEEMIVAKVISHQRRFSFQSIRIAKTAQQKISLGMPVLSPNGIVGRVLNISKYHADIQILTDNNFYIDSVIERTKVRGLSQGTVNEQCKLILHRRADIKIGDHIVTAGLTGSFPKDLSIGSVVKISSGFDNISQLIIIQPTVDLSTLEEVIILQRRDSYLEKIKGTLDQHWNTNFIEYFKRPS
jgi:rod shape-determining protein MreC